MGLLLDQTKIRYLVNYDFQIKNFSKLIQKYFQLVSLEKIKNQEKYEINKILVINDSLDQRDENLKNLLGGISGLYFEVTSQDIIESYSDDIIELQEGSDGYYEAIKIPEPLVFSFKKKYKAV